MTLCWHFERALREKREVVKRREEVERFFLCSGLMCLDVFLDRLSNELGAGYDLALLYEVIDLVQ